MMTPAFARSEKHLNLSGSKAEGAHESHVAAPAFDVCPSLQRVQRDAPDGEKLSGAHWRQSDIWVALKPA